VALALPLVIIGITQRQSAVIQINPSAYTPLLDTIARGESHGNYNAYYGHGSNQRIRFTDMSVADVLHWQQQYVKGGSPSSAVGKYQIIRPTLMGLVRQLKLDTRRTRFDEKLQDRLAITLVERRGAHDFVQSKLTREQFAANLAQEWAALPKATGPNPHQSHYAGDGLNKAHITLDEIFQALATFQIQAST
jgi:muramidase (phage lysozyme)